MLAQIVFCLFSQLAVKSYTIFVLAVKFIFMLMGMYFLLIFTIYMNTNMNCFVYYRSRVSGEDRENNDAFWDIELVKCGDYAIFSEIEANFIELGDGGGS